VKPSSPLKAREIEALTFIYSARPPAVARVRKGPGKTRLRGLSLVFGISMALGLLMVLAWVVLPG
jgi:hypothetical protein